MGKGLEQRRSL